MEDGYVDLLQVMMKSDVFLPPDRDIYDVKMPSSEDMKELEKQWGPLWNAMSPVRCPLPLSPNYMSTSVDLHLHITPYHFLSRNSD